MYIFVPKMAQIGVQWHKKQTAICALPRCVAYLV